ncbi:hypothetical protein [Micromonospora humi]|nr:hypothetical protein [Micromonospora humi]
MSQQNRTRVERSVPRAGALLPESGCGGYREQRWQSGWWRV